MELLYKEEEEIPQQQLQESQKEDGLFECYYCLEFPSTSNKNEYQNHVESNHLGLPPYPSLADLKRQGIHHQGKKLEV